MKTSLLLTTAFFSLPTTSNGEDTSGNFEGIIVEISYRDVVLKPTKTPPEKCGDGHGRHAIKHNPEKNINESTNLQIATSGSAIMAHLSLLDAAKNHRRVTIQYVLRNKICILTDYSVYYTDPPPDKAAVGQ